MKVSVITVCRNAGDLLLPTLKSIAGQKGAEFESIIVDGASTDGSVDVIKRFAAESAFPVKWVSEPDGGVYAALNKGIRMATGDVVGLLYAGDRFTNPDILRYVSSVFMCPTIDYLYGDVKYVEYSTGRCLRDYKSERFLPRMLLNGFAPPHPSLYMRRELFDSVGLYREDYKVAADFEFFVRLTLLRPSMGRYLPAVMVNMEPGGISSRLVNRLWTNNEEKLRALRENGYRVMPLRLLLRYFYL